MSPAWQALTQIYLIGLFIAAPVTFLLSHDPFAAHSPVDRENYWPDLADELAGNAVIRLVLISTSGTLCQHSMSPSAIYHLPAPSAFQTKDTPAHQHTNNAPASTFLTINSPP